MSVVGAVCGCAAGGSAAFKMHLTCTADRFTSCVPGQFCAGGRAAGYRRSLDCAAAAVSAVLLCWQLFNQTRSRVINDLIGAGAGSLR